MMKNILMISVCLWYACSSPQPVEVEGCYMGTVGQDSAFLSIQTQNGRSTGELEYRFYETDHNYGSVEGQLLGDTLLLLNYTFMSEGMESERQVAYLIRDDALVEGYGALEEQEGSMRFKNADELDFGNGFVLYKTDCASMPQK